MPESRFAALKNRFLQRIAMTAPGGQSVRARLHRWRGVKIGTDVWIGYEALIETAYPELVSIGDRSIIGIRSIIIAHFQEIKGVRIESDVFIGPGVIILPGVTIGAGAVVTAGSVVSTSVPPGMLVQGNPAKAVAKCGIPLGLETRSRDFSRHLRKLG